MLVMRVKDSGFTLIEISITLVIIGLLVGGVLVGRDLIKAAEVRAQISQIEKFNQAANTFRGKYGYLPGDIPSVEATQFGFSARGPYAGQGDGNGVIEGILADAPGSACGECSANGESGLFWVDISAAKLIDGSFNTATYNGFNSASSTSVPLYFPQAKIGANMSGGFSSIYLHSNLGFNYFGLTSVRGVSASFPTVSSFNVPVSQAYNIDKKIDDGFPVSGRVMAMWTSGNGSYNWTMGFNSSLGTDSTPNANYDMPISAHSSTCMDNGNDANGDMRYSFLQAGDATNCALSFRMQ